MEIFTVILASILSFLTPGGLILDNIVANRVRSQSGEIDQLAVRIDNVPSYQIISGKVDRVRIASRGVQLTEGIKAEVLEVETDPLDIDLQRLQSGGRDALRASLRQPLRAGIRLVLSAEDLNLALQAPPIKQRIQDILNVLAQSIPTAPDGEYELTEIQLEIPETERLRVQLKLVSPDSEDEFLRELDLLVEVGVGTVTGRTFELDKPIVSINGIVIPSEFTAGLIRGLGNRLDLGNLEEAGILMRILQLELEEDRLEIAAFIQAQPLELESESN